jgi:heme/copper-type cytochrome/quinol oxidase subunit 2
MRVVDLLITIVVVTILVTITLAIITYVAYKLRLARRPVEEEEEEEGLRYYVRAVPPELETGTEAHATEA